MKQADTPMGSWRGRFLLTLAAVAFFVVPFSVGRLADQVRIGQWQDRGFGPEEPRVWWSHDITRLREALAWRAQGFSPERAGAWKTLEFIAVEAREWTEAEFDVLEASEWRRAAFEVAAAREWKSAGLGIGEAVAWRKRAFGPSEAATLKRAGRSPLEAAGERGR